MIRNKEGARQAAYTHKPPLRANSMHRLEGELKPPKKDKGPNIAEKFIQADKIKEDEAKEASRLQMKVINDEMRDMLMMAQDTSGAIKEMNEAFKGDNEYDYISTMTKNNKTKIKKVRRQKTVER